MNIIERILQSVSDFRSKQRLVIMLACFIVLVTTLLCFLAYSVVSFNYESRERLNALGDMIGADVGAALIFNDQPAISKSLETLRGDPSIKQLFVLNEQDQIDGYYLQKNKLVYDDLQKQVKILRSEIGLQIFELSPVVERKIFLDGNRIGSILIKMDEHVIIGKIIASVSISTIILLLALCFSYLLAERFQRVFTDPLTVMTATIREVSHTKDYSMQVPASDTVELNQLAQSFNEMLSVIAQRDKALLESEYRWKFAIEGSGAGVWDWNIETNELSVSERMKDILGCDEGDLPTSYREKNNLVHPDDYAHVSEVMQAYLDGKVLSYVVENRMRFKGNKFIWIIDRGIVVSRSDDGKPLRMIGTVTDITAIKEAEEDRRQLEKQFQHTQKLESLGVLAGGIAHDFNNILTVIMGHCYIAQEDSVSVQDMLDSIRQIESAGNRAADLCRQMLTYAGKSPLVQERVNLWLLVDGVVKMLQSAINKSVTINLDLNQRIPEIIGDTGQLQQIVMNLIINAAEAIGDANGTIEVALTKEVVSAGQEDTDTFGTSILPGRYVCLEVTDSGCGMNEETQNKIFEPFYTTKFIGRGLGMSAIRGIVASHEGLLQLTSSPGVGTTFKVSFPAPEMFPHTGIVSTTLEPLAQSGGTILLVEDEQSLRDMSVSLLDSIGYTVLTAQNGRDGLETYRNQRTNIDMVLLDLIMPVMGGIEAYLELRKLSSTLPIIICSGYNQESVDNIIKNDPCACFVHKPYSPLELRKIMHEMLV